MATCYHPRVRPYHGSYVSARCPDCGRWVKGVINDAAGYRRLEVVSEQDVPAMLGYVRVRWKKDHDYYCIHEVVRYRNPILGSTPVIFIGFTYYPLETLHKQVVEFEWLDKNTYVECPWIGALPGNMFPPSDPPPPTVPVDSGLPMAVLGHNAKEGYPLIIGSNWIAWEMRHPYGRYIVGYPKSQGGIEVRCQYDWRFLNLPEHLSEAFKGKKGALFYPPFCYIRSALPTEAIYSEED